MKKGFTLIELLVVIGIMGLLGTASVGGYRQMRRGMEEKGVLQDATYFIRAAFQRAQIDRQPTVVIFWNETLRGESDNADESAIVVGKAVAVRRSGRISKKDSDMLYDEFADLNLSFPPDGASSAGSSKATMYLYPMDRLSEMKSSSKVLRSLVETACVRSDDDHLVALTGDRMEVSEQMSEDAASGERSGYMYYYGFRLGDQQEENIDWKAGMAYGFEFAHMELPHGYIFGNSYSKTSGNPVASAGTLVFDVAANYGNGISSGAGIIGREKVPIYALRPDPSGNLSATKIGETADPTD